MAAHRLRVLRRRRSRPRLRNALTRSDELRGDAAERTIERSLTTIADREAVGYIAERMVQRHLRLIAVADELGIVAGDTRERTADRA